MYVCTYDVGWHVSSLWSSLYFACVRSVTQAFSPSLPPPLSLSARSLSLPLSRALALSVPLGPHTLSLTHSLTHTLSHALTHWGPAMHRHHQQHLLHHHEGPGPPGNGTAGQQQGSSLDATLMLSSLEPRTGTAPRMRIRKRLGRSDRT
jgi:hypothetical protein